MLHKRSQERRNDAVTVTDGRRVLKVLDAIIKSMAMMQQLGVQPG